MRFEHRHTLQTEQRSRPGSRGREKVTYHRFVCSCGKSTKWRMSLATARVDRDSHALDGQLADTLDAF